MLKEDAAKHDIALGLRMADEAPIDKIWADELRLSQILFNLLSNAVKFTPAGGRIEVTARTEGGRLIVRVADDGIGLKEEDRERIFNVFEQVDTSLGRRRQGTGLGLALTKRLVELHGGTIGAFSDGLGYGSTFEFDISVDSDSRRDGPQTR